MQPNVVPFPRTHAPDPLVGKFKRMLLLLDLSLHETNKMIESCPQTDAQHDLRDQFVHLQGMLNGLRDKTQTLFPATR